MKPLFIGIPIAAFFAWLLGGAVVPEHREEERKEETSIERQAPVPEDAIEVEGLFHFSDFDFSWKQELEL